MGVPREGVFVYLHTPTQQHKPPCIVTFVKGKCGQPKTANHVMCCFFTGRPLPRWGVWRWICAPYQTLVRLWNLDSLWAGQSSSPNTANTGSQLKAPVTATKKTPEIFRNTMPREGKISLALFKVLLLPRWFFAVTIKFLEISWCLVPGPTWRIGCIGCLIPPCQLPLPTPTTMELTWQYSQAGCAANSKCCLTKSKATFTPSQAWQGLRSCDWGNNNCFLQTMHWFSGSINLHGGWGGVYYTGEQIMIKLWLNYWSFMEVAIADSVLDYFPYVGAPYGRPTFRP